MTREEAINVLKHNYPSACFTDLCEAVDIAIQSLSAQTEIIRCENCVFFECGIRCGLRNEQTDYNDFCSKGMNEEEKEPIYCRECKHALLAEYNEGIDVCCLKGGKRKTVSMLDTCEEGEER